MFSNAVGIAGAILGIIGLWATFRSLREKRPQWAVRSVPLVDEFNSKYENLRVTYERKPVENLTISKVLFWNAGRETITKTDLDTINPLRIVAKDKTRLLDVKVLVSNHDASRIDVRPDKRKNCAFLKFDYLDHTDGAVLQVVHTGKSSGDLEISGDIRGVRRIHQVAKSPGWVRVLRRMNTSPGNNRTFTLVLAWFNLAFGVFAILRGAASFFAPPQYQPPGPPMLLSV